MNIEIKTHDLGNIVHPRYGVLTRINGTRVPYAQIAEVGNDPRELFRKAASAVYENWEEITRQVRDVDEEER